MCYSSLVLGKKLSGKEGHSRPEPSQFATLVRRSSNSFFRAALFASMFGMGVGWTRPNGGGVIPRYGNPMYPTQLFSTIARHASRKCCSHQLNQHGHHGGVCSNLAKSAVRRGTLWRGCWPAGFSKQDVLICLMYHLGALASSRSFVSNCPPKRLLPKIKRLCDARSQ